MVIRIKNLRLRTIIGINDWERNEIQDVVLNVEIVFDGNRVVETGHLVDTVDYKKMKKRIIKQVENSKFYLLDKLAGHVLNIVMEDEKVVRATVEIDKPQALRFADSVSICCSGRRKEDGSWQLVVE
ncbi:dihydroneopterin aldolase [bacterium]|nr:dihydroneopterin aldolase [bacterium]